MVVEALGINEYVCAHMCSKNKKAKGRVSQYLRGGLVRRKIYFLKFLKVLAGEGLPLKTLQRKETFNKEFSTNNRESLESVHWLTQSKFGGEAKGKEVGGSRVARMGSPALQQLGNT